MSGRKIKCQYCGVSDTPKDEMEVYMTGNKKPTPKYYHKGSCYDKFIKEKEFKEQEAKELDKLVEVIMEIHKIKKLPPQAYPYINELRNGDIMFGKRKKKYKEGFSYSLIAETYIYCKDAIGWAKANKDFSGFMNEFKYAWVIINDKIGVVKRKKEKEEHLKKLEEAREEKKQETMEFHSTDVIYNKKRTKTQPDLTDFLS